MSYRLTGRSAPRTAQCLRKSTLLALQDQGRFPSRVWLPPHRLEAEGIVEIVPRQGVYLIDYDPRKAVEIYFAREALSKVTERHLAWLATNIAEQKTCLGKGDIEGYAAAAIAFHEQIVKIANNKTLERLFASIYAQIRAMRVQMKYFPTHLPQSCDDHARLVEALRRGDPDLAEQEARQHIQMLRAEIDKGQGNADAKKAERRSAPCRPERLIRKRYGSGRNVGACQLVTVPARVPDIWKQRSLRSNRRRVPRRPGMT